MALDSTHPLYDRYVQDWITMRDLFEGERAVKAKGEVYLPPTKGMILDGMATGKLGREVYDAYKLRAVFPDFVKDGVITYDGLLHQDEASIELPAVMEPLRQRATVFGESLQALLRRINVGQLITGRVGLLADLPLNPSLDNPLPLIALYTAETVRNWDDGEAEEGESRLNMVVLDESGPVRISPFQWEHQTKYRVLQLGALQENEVEATYYQGTFVDDTTYTAGAMSAPMLRGAKLSKIPFVFVNADNITPVPSDPPLLGLGRIALAVYRGEADYRQNLFMQGQDTLVVIGGMRRGGPEEVDTGPVRTGAGSMIEVDIGGDAKYIGVSSAGLSEQRQALENDRQVAQAKAGQLISSRSSQQESGEALKTRITAQTASLNTIALSGAAGLEKLLKIVAEWMGANPDEVKIAPNLEFADFDVGGRDFVELMTARTMGAPISKESIHGLMVERGITKLDYETEQDLVEQEG